MRFMHEIRKHSRVRALACLLLIMAWVAGGTVLPFAAAQAHATCGHCTAAPTMGHGGHEAALPQPLDPCCDASSPALNAALNAHEAPCQCSLQAPLAPGAQSRPLAVAGMDAPRALVPIALPAVFTTGGPALVADSFVNRAPPVASTPRFILLKSFRC